MENIETIADIIDDATDRVERLLKGMKRVRGESECGLDRRAGTVWVDEDCVIARTDSKRNLDYYGGFEYCDCTPIGLGDYTIFIAAEDSTGRVQDVIDRTFGREVDEDEDED